MTIDILPLDCLRIIAKYDIASYQAMLTIRKFALDTLGKNNENYKQHFSSEIKPKKPIPVQYDSSSSDEDTYRTYKSNRRFGQISPCTQRRRENRVSYKKNSSGYKSNHGYNYGYGYKSSYGYRNY